MFQISVSVNSAVKIKYCKLKNVPENFTFADLLPHELKVLPNRQKRLHNITITCLCNVYPLIPHFYIAKLGYAGVYLFVLVLLQNIDCGYLLKCEPTVNVLNKNIKKNLLFFRL